MLNLYGIESDKHDENADAKCLCATSFGKPK